MRMVQQLLSAYVVKFLLHQPWVKMQNHILNIESENIVLWERQGFINSVLIMLVIFKTAQSVFFGWMTINTEGNTPVEVNFIPYCTWQTHGAL